VFDGVGVSVMVGVSVGSGVSVGGSGEKVGVADRAAEVRITINVRSAMVSGAPGTLGIVVVFDIPQAMTTMTAINEMNAKRLFCLFMDPPDPD
jgi:hypothetical protein